MKPKMLQQGDTIGVVAPSSPPDMVKLKHGFRIYEKYGLKMKLSPLIAQREMYLAGTDEERAHNFMEMFLDPEVKGVFSAYGGYGSARMVEYLDFEGIQANPKVFWGYSDSTFLHLALYQQTGLVTFHGPMMSSDLGGEVDPLTELYLSQVMKPKIIIYDESISPLYVINQPAQPRTAPVIGGNLTLLISSLGTPFEINTLGKILFIEDVDEEPYRVDRMINQLRMAGKLAQAEAVIIGDFHRCFPRKRTESFSIEDILLHHVKKANVPAIGVMSAGHGNSTISFPLGANATIDFDNKTITFEPGLRGE
ncbi:S66 peptidase family protein [Alkalicoccobacillus porphyridii]|uniref:LD-carboxypeptidase n=1 Tax=Alkalicoccobacillus porphyridii TaxID=2597270 RepID=A0A553ZVE8_9BACI|nr:LD-carboxypeptidase [Alkalicoccobacillus porphyridii]TSB45461.1 LD-carboxypeptidase [Alkalicoccobacillus porphyridii]